ncbi:MAG: hypothetical protein IK151_05525 [Erysipelotrichaceae bacterium]|nr:hypothetical protein [Erysipelotrichaceae bacterium]
MSEIRYGKPNMNNLPYELGKAIFEEIRNSPRVDREAIRKEVEEFKKRVIEERRRKGYDY